jgi:hypothetical protein
MLEAILKTAEARIYTHKDERVNHGTNGTPEVK